ncbi:MAG TPA: hypothetical protein DD706_11915, partial [Nitrospiraceae bacterium]|nr:hypothetical protein [Nitrospiraceae bacterium]
MGLKNCGGGSFCTYAAKFRGRMGTILITRIGELLWKIRGFGDWLIYAHEVALRFQGGGGRGFAPVRRGPFVSAKGPKTILAVAWPSGCPPRFTDT